MVKIHPFLESEHTSGKWSRVGPSTAIHKSELRVFFIHSCACFDEFKL